MIENALEEPVMVMSEILEIFVWSKSIEPAMLAAESEIEKLPGDKFEAALTKVLTLPKVLGWMMKLPPLCCMSAIAPLSALACAEEINKGILLLIEIEEIFERLDCKELRMPAIFEDVSVTLMLAT